MDTSALKKWIIGDLILILLIIFGFMIFQYTERSFYLPYVSASICIFILCIILSTGAYFMFFVSDYHSYCMYFLSGLSLVGFQIFAGFSFNIIAFITANYDSDDEYGNGKDAFKQLRIYSFIVFIPSVIALVCLAFFTGMLGVRLKTESTNTTSEYKTLNP